VEKSKEKYCSRPLISVVPLNHRGFLFIFSLLIFFSMTTFGCFAESHLTNPANSTEDGVLFLDEEIPVEIQNEDLYITIKSTKYKKWGPVSKEKPVKKSKKIKRKKSRYPSINVRYRVYVGKPIGKKKYKKRYSSRGGGTKVVYVNITPIIIREARRNRISPTLLKALIRTESGYNCYAKGPSGALGLCQLMPGTARRMGVRDPFNPEQNIKGGAKLLGMLKRKYGSTDRALAAYNLGEGYVSRHGGIPGCAWRFIKDVKRNMRW